MNQILKTKVSEVDVYRDDHAGSLYLNFSVSLRN